MRTWIVRLTLKSLIVLLPFWAAVAFAAETWQPAKTWVFAVGLVEFQDQDSYKPFSSKERKDDELIKVLKARGVPANQIVYLKDRRATRDNVVAALEKMLEKTKDGDFLWFYYESHGLFDNEGGVRFVTYDTDDDVTRTALSAAQILSRIESKFRGSHVLLTADSCYSGGLCSVARRRKTNLSYGCVTSVDPENLSTGNWTFTEALIAGLEGHAHVDLDKNGSVEFDELVKFSKQEMAEFENQKISAATTKNFDRKLKIATAKKRVEGSRIGDRIEVLFGKEWYKARVIGERKNGTLRVRYIGSDSSEDEWVPANRTRRITLPKN